MMMEPSIAASRAQARQSDDRAETARTRRFIKVLCNAADVTPWKSVAIGEPGYPGAARFEGEAENRCLLVCAGGRGFSGEKDEFHFVYQEWSGDVTLTARVADLMSDENTASVGVMLRESLGPDARYAAMFVRAKPDVRNGRGGRTKKCFH